MSNKTNDLRNENNIITFFVVIVLFLFFSDKQIYTYYQQNQSPYSASSFQTENLYSESGPVVLSRQFHNNWAQQGFGGYKTQSYPQESGFQIQSVNNNYANQDEEDDTNQNAEDDYDGDESYEGQNEQNENTNASEYNNITVGLVPVVNNATSEGQSNIGSNNNIPPVKNMTNSWVQQGFKSYDEQQNYYGLDEQTVADVSETIKMSFLAGGVGFMAYRIGSWVAQKFAKKAFEKVAEDATAESSEGAVNSAVAVAEQEAVEQATKSSIEEAVEQAVDEAIQATVEEVITASIEAGEIALENAAIAA